MFATSNKPATPQETLRDPLRGRDPSLGTTGLEGTLVATHSLRSPDIGKFIDQLLIALMCIDV